MGSHLRMGIREKVAGSPGGRVRLSWTAPQACEKLRGRRPHGVPHAASHHFPVPQHWLHPQAGARLSQAMGTAPAQAGATSSL